MDFWKISQGTAAHPWPDPLGFADRTPTRAFRPERPRRIATSGLQERAGKADGSRKKSLKASVDRSHSQSPSPHRARKLRPQALA
ncbi:MAG: hypothetical protein ACO4CS_04005 [bacterium]